MNDTETQVLDAIRRRIASGFDTQSDIEQMVDDIAEGDCVVAELKSLVGPAFRAKLRAERGWPETTDCDRLDRAFAALHMQGICALANAGYTMADGHADIAEVLVTAPEDHYHGFCFYHGQDVERAVDGAGLMIAFGDLGDDEDAAVRVGRTVAESLRDAGFQVDWNGSAKTRIALPVLDWKRRSTSRSSSADAMTTAAVIEHWMSRSR